MRTLLLFFLAAMPAFADETTLMVRATAWLMDAKGTIRGDDDGIVGTALDIDRILNSEDHETGFGGTVGFPLFWGMRARFDYWTEDFNGTTVLAAPVTFGGSVFTAGSRVISNTDFDVGTLTLEYNHAFQLTDDAALRLSGILGARWIDFQAQLKNTNALIPFTEREEFSIFLPTVGARLEMQITQWLAVDLMAQWFSAESIENRDVDTLELMGGASFTFFKGAYLGAGWRFVDFDIIDQSKPGERLDLDVEFSGVYLELGYRF